MPQYKRINWAVISQNKKIDENGWGESIYAGEHLATQAKTGELQYLFTEGLYEFYRTDGLIYRCELEEIELKPVFRHSMRWKDFAERLLEYDNDYMGRVTLDKDNRPVFELCVRNGSSYGKKPAEQDWV